MRDIQVTQPSFQISIRTRPTFSTTVPCCECQRPYPHHISLRPTSHQHTLRSDMAPIRLRHPKGVLTLQVDIENSSVLDLQQQIYSVTEIPPSQQERKLNN